MKQSEDQSNTKMIQSRKVKLKNGVICLVYMVLKLSKKVHLCNFVLTSERNLGLLKQFTYMRLKVFITLYGL